MLGEVNVTKIRWTLRARNRTAHELVLKKFICAVCAILSSVLHVHLHPLLTLELDLIIIPTAKQATTALGNAADTFL